MRVRDQIDIDHLTRRAQPHRCVAACLKDKMLGHMQGELDAREREFHLGDAPTGDRGVWFLLKSRCCGSETIRRTTMTADTSWPSAFSCPECLGHSGRAFKVQSHGFGKILVELRCKSCAHEWELERDTPTFAVRPKKDRRQRPRTDAPIGTWN